MDAVLCKFAVRIKLTLNFLNFKTISLKLECSTPHYHILNFIIFPRFAIHKFDDFAIEFCIFEYIFFSKSMKS